MHADVEKGLLANESQVSSWTRLGRVHRRQSAKAIPLRTFSSNSRKSEMRRVMRMICVRPSARMLYACREKKTMIIRWRHFGHEVSRLCASLLRAALFSLALFLSVLRCACMRALMQLCTVINSVECLLIQSDAWSNSPHRVPARH